MERMCMCFCRIPVFRYFNKALRLNTALIFINKHDTLICIEYIIVITYKTPTPDIFYSLDHE